MLDTAMANSVTHMYNLFPSCKSNSADPRFASIHSLPDFHVRAKDTGKGKFVNRAFFFFPLLDPFLRGSRYICSRCAVIRAVLINEVYRRVRMNFDEYDAYVFGNDEYAFSALSLPR